RPAAQPRRGARRGPAPPGRSGFGPAGVSPGGGGPREDPDRLGGGPPRAVAPRGAAPAVGAALPRVTGGALPAAGAAPESDVAPKQLYETAYGYLLQRDYGAAEAAFQDFLQRFPNDPLAGNAQYWLGESLFVRGQYRSAA